MVCSPDGDTDFFDINTGVLQSDILAFYLFIICLYNDLPWNLDISNKRKPFHTKEKKARSKRDPTETMTDADYKDDQALLANTPTKAEFQQHIPEQCSFSYSGAVFICFKQKEAISTQSGQLLKLVN